MNRIWFLVEIRVGVSLGLGLLSPTVHGAVAAAAVTAMQALEVLTRKPSVPSHPLVTRLVVASAWTGGALDYCAGARRRACAPRAVAAATVTGPCLLPQPIACGAGAYAPVAPPTLWGGRIGEPHALGADVYFNPVVLEESYPQD